MKAINWNLEGAAFYAQFGYDIAGLSKDEVFELDLAVERAGWEIEGYRNRNGDLVAPSEAGLADPFGVTAAYVGGQFEAMNK